MSRDDEMTEAADEALEMLNQAPRGGVDHDDQIETGIEQETPTVGGDEVDGRDRDADGDREQGDEPAVRAACRFCETEFRTRVAERRHHCMGRDATHTTAVDGRTLLEPAVHEFEGNFLFTPDDSVLKSHQEPTAPFFAIASVWHKFLATGEDGNDDIGEFEAIGETWEIVNENVNKWDSQIATRPGDKGEVFSEFNLQVATVDEVGDRDVNFQFRIAIPNATNAETGEPIQSLPDDLPEGIRVQLKSTNVEPHETFEVLRAVMKAADVDPRYFDNQFIDEWSRVFTFALYVRVLREISEEKIVALDGLLDRIARFSSVRRGEGEYTWDNKEIIGHRNTVAMNPQSLEKLYESHTVGKLLKSYHMKHPERQAGDSPTAHPKLEVQFSTEYTPSDYESIPWTDSDAFDFEDLRHEIDEFLIFALNAAELPLHADTDTYVEDQYWTPEESQRGIEVHADKTEELREAEEELATYQLASDDVTPAQRAVLATLADGGRPMDREELADSSETSTSTVQRAYETFGSVITRIERGVYDLADDVIRDKVAELLDGLEDVAEWVEEGIDALASGHGQITEDSPLANWARNHRARIQEQYDGLEIEVAGDRDLVELRRVLRAGLEAARATGSKAARDFADAQITFKIDGDRRTQKAFSRIGSGLKILGAEDVDLV